MHVNMNKSTTSAFLDFTIYTNNNFFLHSSTKIQCICIKLNFTQYAVKPLYHGLNGTKKVKYMKLHNIEVKINKETVVVTTKLWYTR